MSTRKLLLLIAAALVLLSSASAQSIQVEGLTQENVNSTLEQNGVRFTTSYLNKTIPYKDVFVPEYLQDDLKNFKAQFQSQGNQEKLQIQIQFQAEQKDSDDDMPDFLSQYKYQAQQQVNPGQIQFQVQSSLDTVDLGNGTSMEEDADYDVQIQNNGEKVEIDGSLNRKIGGKQILNDASMNFSNTAGEFSFDTGVIKPQISAHYEHLIVNHKVRSSVSPEYGRTVNETEKVYSGEGTGRFPISFADTSVLRNQEVNDQRVTLKLDNRYEEKENVTIVVAYPEKYSFADFQALGINSSRLDGGIDWYSEAEDRIIENGLNQSLLIPNTDEYSFKAYNITLPSNKAQIVRSDIETGRFTSVEGIKTYVIGSIGGTTTYETQAGGTSKLHDTFNDANLNGWTTLSGDWKYTTAANYQDGYGLREKGGSWSEIKSMFGEEAGEITFWAANHNGNDVYLRLYDSSGSEILNQEINANYNDAIGDPWTKVRLEIDESGCVDYYADGAYQDNFCTSGTDIYGIGFRIYVGDFDHFYYKPPNEPPVFDDEDTTPSNWKIDTAIDLAFNVSDPDSGDSVSSVQARMLKDGNEVVPYTSLNTGSSSDFVLDNFYTPNGTANYTLRVKAEDSNNGYNISVTDQEITNQAPVVDALNTPDNTVKVNTTSPSLSLDVSDPDGDNVDVEYFLNGTSIGTDSGVSSGSSSSLEATGLDWGSFYEWNASLIDGNGGTATSSTYQFTTQKKPDLVSFSWNNSDPIYGDTVRLEAEISDPENDYITETFLSAEENGSQIFSGNGSKDNGFWVSDPIKVDEANVWYNGSVHNSTDIHGATASFSTGNTASFYIDNPPPRISSAKLVDDRRNDDRKLELVLDDRAQSDIGSSSGITNIQTFTNSSLVAGIQDTAFGSDIKVSDFPGLSSDPFTVNFTVANSGLKDAPSITGNLSSQQVVQTLNITNKAGSELNYSQVFTQVDNGENLTRTEISGTVQPGSTVSNTAEWRGDWIQEQAYNTSFGSGQVVYGGGIEQRFNATQRVYTNNTQSNVSFNIDFTAPVSTGFSQCQLVNNTVQPVAAGQAGNHTFIKSCDPGREVSYTPVQKTDLGDKYKYNLTTQVEVFSELTSEQEHWIGIPQTRLDNWEERNPEDTKAYVDGQSSEVSVEQGVVNGTEYVFVVVSDQFGNSSLHTGEHTASLIYTEGGGSSTSTGGQIGSPIEQVDGQEYSWDLYNVRSQEQEDVGFSIAGVPGREFERRLAVQNTGDQPVMLELECVSRGDACNWVNTSVDRIRLDTQDNTVSYFDVKGRVPTTAETEDVYRFRIRASDPSFDESTPSTSGSASADFVVSISPFFGSVIEGIRDLLSWKEFEPPEWAMSGASSISYPFAALPVFSSISIYGLLGLLQRRYSVEVSSYDEIGKFAVAFLVFVVVTGLA